MGAKASLSKVQESGGRRHRPRDRSMVAGQSQRGINPQACAWLRRVRVPIARRCPPTDLRTSPHWPWRKVPGDRKKKSLEHTIVRADEKARHAAVSINLNLRTLLRLGRQHPQAAYFPAGSNATRRIMSPFSTHIERPPGQVQDPSASLMLLNCPSAR